MADRVRTVLVALCLTVSLLGVAVAPAAGGHEGGDACEFPVTVTDNTDTEVTVSESPERVVVLDAASAQVLWEIGAEDRVVGMPVRPYTDYLEGSDERTDVLSDDGMTVDVETVVDLDADLVIAPNYVPPETIAQLRDANLTVFQSNFEQSFADIYAKTELFGHFVGECGAAADTVEETRSEVESIRETVADRDSPRVLYYFFGSAAANGTFINDIVETAGGSNVAAEAGLSGYPEISDEVILDRDPEWIVTTDDPNSIDVEAEPFASTTAVANDQVLEVDANLVSQAGPRVVEPLRTMAEAFHPEAFEDEAGSPTSDEATPTATPTAAPTADGGDETPTPAEAAADDEGPGFTAGLAALAVLSVALIGARRR